MYIFKYYYYHSFRNCRNQTFLNMECCLNRIKNIIPKIVQISIALFLCYTVCFISLNLLIIVFKILHLVLRRNETRCIIIIEIPSDLRRRNVLLLICDNFLILDLTYITSVLIRILYYIPLYTYFAFGFQMCILL